MSNSNCDYSMRINPVPPIFWACRQKIQFKNSPSRIIMKSAIVFVVLSVAVMAFARPEEHYTDRYDNLDLDEILSNRRLLVPYVKCVLDQGKCAPDAKELKGTYSSKYNRQYENCDVTSVFGYIEHSGQSRRKLLL